MLRAGTCSHWRLRSTWMDIMRCREMISAITHQLREGNQTADALATHTNPELSMLGWEQAGWRWAACQGASSSGPRSKRRRWRLVSWWIVLFPTTACSSINRR
ncbi:unnamed protein product [Spirodela intermedia]|uniref:RNase H type-1 domain-containing protein n=1 Tax=Spirodela intermedia TaxID=51605 RepID=A0ABN7E9B8_SPIIN|nr:unnamed protein product [Spirodela intermedia]